jgi:hypothetical protein
MKTRATVAINEKHITPEVFTDLGLFHQPSATVQVVISNSEALRILHAETRGRPQLAQNNLAFSLAAVAMLAAEPNGVLYANKTD